MRLSHPSMSLACFAAAVVFATVAAASTPFIRWMDEPADGMASLRVQPGASSVAPALERRVGAKSACGGCGVVESVVLIERARGQPASYELTVRLRDGSRRTSNIAHLGRWRAGDRIMLIGGTQSASL